RDPSFASLRASPRRRPSAGALLQPGLVGDAHRAVADLQTFAVAGDLLCQERQPRRLDEVRAGQHAIARHADDVALEAAEIRQKDLDRLLLALCPALGDPLVPERD